jgi:hypothetical protein
MFILYRHDIHSTVISSIEKSGSASHHSLKHDTRRSSTNVCQGIQSQRGHWLRKGRIAAFGRDVLALDQSPIQEPLDFFGLERIGVGLVNQNPGVGSD